MKITYDKVHQMGLIYIGSFCKKKLTALKNQGKRPIVFVIVILHTSKIFVIMSGEFLKSFTP